MSFKVCKLFVWGIATWSYTCLQKNLGGDCPRGVMVNVLEYGIVVSKFKLQSRYYVHVRTSTLGKGMNPLILLASG